MPDPISTKQELIKKWTCSIAKLNQQIAQLQADKTLSVAERQRKIARRQEIINGYKFSIEQAKEYLEAQHRKSQALFGKAKTK